MPIDLSALDTLPIDELRALWAANMGRSTPPRQRRLLVRELAWRTQERSHGGLDANTRRLLDRAIRDATRDAASGDPADHHAGEAPATKRRARRAVSTGRANSGDLSPLPTATKLSRVWRGVRYEVDVLEGGRRFRLRGRDQIYASLSEIAREITGARWSGPRFFGLTTRERAGGEQPNPRSGKGRRGGTGERS